MSPFMPATLPSGKVQAFWVGEGPGTSEEIANRQFVGPAGKLLRRKAKQAGWDMSKVAIQNGVRCGKRKPTTKELRLCRSFLIKEINKVKAPIILALGANAGKALQDEGRVTVGRDRNRDIPIPGLTYTPIKKTLTYHPAAVLRGNMDAGEALSKDLKRLKTKPIPKTSVVYKQVTTLPELEILCREFSKATAFSPDIEWGEDGKILTISVCAEKGVAYWWAVEHKESVWTWSDVKPHLDILFGSQTTKVGHNIQGDILHLAMHGVEVAGPLLDTLVLVKMNNENYPDKSLEHLVINFLNMPDYAAAMRVYKKGIKLQDGWKISERTGKKLPKYKVVKDFALAPLQVLGPYNAGDADAGWRLAKALIKKARKNKWWPLFKIYMKAERILTRNTHEGFRVNKNTFTKKTKTMTRQANARKHQFLKLIAKYWPKKKGPFRFKKDNYNPNDEDLRYLLFVRLKFKSKERTKTGKKSVNKKTLNTLKKQDKLGIIKLLIGWTTKNKKGEEIQYYGLRQYDKLLGTYLIGMRKKIVYKKKHTIQYEGKKITIPAGWYFMPGYNIAGAKTGRLSSRPNIQNIPKVIRSAFITRWSK